MEQLIDAVLAHAKFLRKSARAGDDYIARAAEQEAEQWEAMVATARAELLALRPSCTISRVPDQMAR
jgi:hypothetical protein